MSTSFGKVIPVTGLLNGFPGTPSRQGVPVITSRRVLSTAAHAVSFGEAVVAISDTTGGTFQSIRDFVATLANIPLLTTQFAGIAVREVKSHLTYPVGVTPGTDVIGSYAVGAIMDALEQGTVTVLITHGTPGSDGAVYARVAASASLTATSVGDLEAAADTVSTTGTCASGTSLAVNSGTGIVAGQIVTGAGIADGTYVAAVSGTTVTLSQAVTSALSTTAVVFASTVKLPYVVFKTGSLDANGVAEILIKVRNAA